MGQNRKCYCHCLINKKKVFLLITLSHDIWLEFSMQGALLCVQMWNFVSFHCVQSSRTKFHHFEGEKCSFSKFLAVVAWWIFCLHRWHDFRTWCIASVGQKYYMCSLTCTDDLTSLLHSFFIHFFVTFFCSHFSCCITCARVATCVLFTVHCQWENFKERLCHLRRQNNAWVAVPLRIIET